MTAFTDGITSTDLLVRRIGSVCAAYQMPHSCGRFISYYGVGEYTDPLTAVKDGKRFRAN